MNRTSGEQWATLRHGKIEILIVIAIFVSVAYNRIRAAGAIGSPGTEQPFQDEAIMHLTSGGASGIGTTRDTAIVRGRRPLVQKSDCCTTYSGGNVCVHRSSNRCAQAQPRNVPSCRNRSRDRPARRPVWTVAVPACHERARWLRSEAAAGRRRCGWRP